MLFWFLVAGVLLLVFCSGYWYVHKRGDDVGDPVQARRIRADAMKQTGSPFG
jgi:hypothetical protein